MSNKDKLINNLTQVINLIEPNLSEQGLKDSKQIKEKLKNLKNKSKK